MICIATRLLSLKCFVKMKVVFELVVILCVCANLQLAHAGIKVQCSAKPGTIIIMKEAQSSQEGTYYRIEGTIAEESAQGNYRKQQQKGNPRKLEVVRKLLVKDCRKAEQAAHSALDRESFQHVQNKWYLVKPNKEQEFIRTVQKAVESEETFLMLDAILERYEEGKRGVHKK